MQFLGIAFIFIISCQERENKDLNGQVRLKKIQGNDRIREI